MTAASGLEGEDYDPLAEARAYNQSVLFMLTVPYLIFGTAAFLIYRGLNRKDGPAIPGEEVPA